MDLNNNYSPLVSILNQVVAQGDTEDVHTHIHAHNIMYYFMYLFDILNHAVPHRFLFGLIFNGTFSVASVEQ